MGMGFNTRVSINGFAETEVYVELGDIRGGSRSGAWWGEVRFYSSKDYRDTYPEANITSSTFINEISIPYTYGVNPELSLYAELKSLFPNPVDVPP